MVNWKDHTEWFDRSYTFDWAVATGFWFLSYYVDTFPVFQRTFQPDDPIINHPNTQQQVSGGLLTVLSIYAPVALAIILGVYQRSLIQVHHGILALWSGRGLTRLITEFLKSRIGRLRPDFLARCKWSESLGECTGDPSLMMDGRRSFPSGHSSAAFAAMTFIALLVAGKTAGWSKLARLSMSLLPMLVASWVAITRIEDYRHRKEDVIVGSLIGIISAGLCYHIFWPIPFFQKSITGQPRMLYVDGLQSENGTQVFELSRMEEDGLEDV